MVCLVLSGGGSRTETRLSSPTSNLGWFRISLILDAIEVFLDPATDFLGDFTLPAADGGLDPACCSNLKSTWNKLNFSKVLSLKHKMFFLLNKSPNVQCCSVNKLRKEKNKLLFLLMIVDASSDEISSFSLMLIDFNLLVVWSIISQNCLVSWFNYFIFFLNHS